METNRIDIAENIFRMVKNMSADVKLELISKITGSLKGTKKRQGMILGKNYLVHGNLKKVLKK